MTPKNFAMIGAAGYIAPRHLRAIHETGNRLVTATDPHDAVGILDQYFPDSSFFVEFERFDRHLEKLRRKGEDRRVHYVSICSPNYLHDAHIRAALRVHADAICEKPLVLNPWNLDALHVLEQETGNRVRTILQLRHHQTIIDLKKAYSGPPSTHRHQVVLTYITSRGQWYHYSWKGIREKSGGLASNIGIHFFDMLMWIFGTPTGMEVHYDDSYKVGGYLELPNADVRWFLSVDPEDLPEVCKEKGQRTFRSITIDGQEVEFSEGFTDLHTISYRGILEGGGFGLEDARPSIELVQRIRVETPVMNPETAHPAFSVPIHQHQGDE